MDSLGLGRSEDGVVVVADELVEEGPVRRDERLSLGVDEVPVGGGSMALGEERQFICNPSAENKAAVFHFLRYSVSQVILHFRFCKKKKKKNLPVRYL